MALGCVYVCMCMCVCLCSVEWGMYFTGGREKRKRCPIAMYNTICLVTFDWCYIYIFYLYIIRLAEIPLLYNGHIQQQFVKLKGLIREWMIVGVACLSIVGNISHVY